MLVVVHVTEGGQSIDSNKHRRIVIMFRISTIVVTVAIGLGMLTLTGCATGQTGDQISQAPTGIHELTALYERATAYHRRAAPRPIHVSQARAMRLLAAKADTFLAESKAWDSDARLVGIAASEKPAAKRSVGEFRTALTGVKDAAETSNRAALLTEYRNMMASYQDLVAKIGPMD